MVGDSRGRLCPSPTSPGRFGSSHWACSCSTERPCGGAGRQDDLSLKRLASHLVGILGSPVGSRKRIAKIVGFSRNLAVSKLKYRNTIHRRTVVVTDRPFPYGQLSMSD